MQKSNALGREESYQSPVCRIVNLRVRHTILAGSIEDIYAGALEAGKDMIDDPNYTFEF